MTNNERRVMRTNEGELSRVYDMLDNSPEYLGFVVDNPW